MSIILNPRSRGIPLSTYKTDPEDCLTPSRILRNIRGESERTHVLNMQSETIIRFISVALLAIALWELTKFTYSKTLKWKFIKHRNNIFRIIKEQAYIAKSESLKSAPEIHKLELITQNLIKRKLSPSIKVIDIKSYNMSETPPQDLIIIGSPEYNEFAHWIQKSYCLTYEFVSDSNELEPQISAQKIIGQSGSSYIANQPQEGLELNYDYALLFITRKKNGGYIIWMAGIQGAGTIGVMKFLSSGTSLEFLRPGLTGEAASLWLFRISFKNTGHTSIEMIQSVERIDGPNNCTLRKTPERPKALIFDMGNVLLFFKRDRAHRSIATYYKVDIAQVEHVIEKSDLLSRYETGKLSTEEFNIAVHEYLRVDQKIMPLEQFRITWGNIFWPNEKMINAVKILKKQGVKLILCSNTNEAHYSFIEEHYPDVLKFFEGNIVLSYKEKCLKPNQKIFEISRSRLGADIRFEDCILIDDLTENIKSAIDAGMNGIVYHNHEHFVLRLRQFGCYIP